MLNKEEIETQRFTDEEIKIVKGYIKERLKWKDWDNKAFYITMNAYTLVKHIENIESDKQKLIEKLEERIKAVDKCYNELLTDIGGIKVIYVTGLTKKEKEEIINKRNCLLVQKYCYEEILEILK